MTKEMKNSILGRIRQLEFSIRNAKSCLDEDFSCRDNRLVPPENLCVYTVRLAVDRAVWEGFVQGITHMGCKVETTETWHVKRIDWGDGDVWEE